MTTILAATTDTTQHAAEILAPDDVLDIQCALQNAAATDCTTLSTADRQAFALLTYWDDCPSIYRLLVTRILDGTLALPLNERASGHLLALIDRLPAVTGDDVDAWLADRDIETPSAVDRIINILAAYTATRAGDPGYPLLYGALQTVIRTGKPSIPLADIPGIAQAELTTALADLDADGLIPPPQDDPVERALRIIAARAARHTDSTGDTLRWALRVLVAELAHDGPSPIPDVEQWAAHEWVDQMVEQARRDHQAAEYDNTPLAVAL